MNDLLWPVWFTIAGGLLLMMTLGGSMLSRLPVSTAMLYLVAGALLSPLWLGLTTTDAIADASWVEHGTEIVILISLFSSGLRMSAGLHDRRWLPPLRLALLSMLLTVVLISVSAMLLLGLSLGAAILLGGILAPTDPVLASDVQIADPRDRDELRYALTGEGGLNDGTAFPVVMLGLGLLELHEIGSFGWQWLAIDVFWSVGAGLGIGAALGATAAQLVLHLRREHHEAVGLDNFLALGLIASANGVALLAHASGFLAVFAAGVALRSVEQRHTAAAKPRTADSPGTRSGTRPPDAEPIAVVEHALATATPTQAEHLATHPRYASAFMAHAVLSFNEQLDRMGEMAAVVLVGTLLWSTHWQFTSWWFVLLLLLVIRPLSVAAGLHGARVPRMQKQLIAWFGIRGIGSLFYLTYAINRGLTVDLADTLTAITLSVIVTSIVVHGISVTPLMTRYQALRQLRNRGP